MSLLVAEHLEKAYGDRIVLRDAGLRIRSGERVGLVGVNGGGKSTLLRILAGAESADGGELRREGTVGWLEQDPRLPGRTVGDAMGTALTWHRELLQKYHEAVARRDMEAMSALQERLDRVGWDLDHRVDAMLDRLDAPGRPTPLERLSGGEHRRVALAHALLGDPEILLLDEPTNHLDAATAEWLQEHLRGFRGALVMVTHDRYLHEAVSERIVELEDGVAVSYEGSYGDYLVARAERQALLHRAESVRQSLIEREAAWAARSPAARTSRCKARLGRLERLRAQRPPQRRSDMQIRLQTGERMARILLEAEGLSHGFSDEFLFRDLDFSLERGAVLGVMGPNGCGKSTLLQVLAGRITPRAGRLFPAPRTRIALFDQERTGLDPADTVFEAAGGGNSHVRVGDRFVHVASFLDRFLFPSPMHDQPVSVLSGGERARLLLARLLLKGCNILLLDEPTNDLDLQTLRVLEEALIAFDGAAAVVTHDRAFLDRVCSGVLSFEGEGRVRRYASRLQALRALPRPAPEPDPAPSASASAPRRRNRTRKLSFHEKGELEALPARIERAETRHAEVEGLLADPATYREAGADPAALTAEMHRLAAEIEQLYDRWAALETIAEGS